MTFQFNFQHSELQSKKEKLTRLEDKRINEANSRNSSVSAAREMLRRLRDNSSNNDTSSSTSTLASSNMYANLSSNELKQRLQHTMDVDGEEQLLRTIPELIKIRKVQKVEEVKELEMKNASLRRVIAGYQILLGVESTTTTTTTTDVGTNCGLQDGSLVLQQ
jgi:hypothetical protein